MPFQRAFNRILTPIRREAQVTEGVGAIRRVQDASVDGRTVLVRVDYNVPMRDGCVTDDTRIRASLPTLTLLLDRGAKVIVATHLGRPHGKIDPSLRLEPISECLSEIMGRSVVQLDDCVGPKVAETIAAGEPGDLLMLENLRFHPEESANDREFAQQLARLADLYVSDAFATIHRTHASTLGVAEILPAYAGCLVQREVASLGRLLDSPERPYVAIVGGKKAASKLGPLRDLVGRVDRVIVGGGVAFSMLAAQGASVGNSIVDESVFGEILKILEAARARGVEIALPIDARISRELEPSAETDVADASEIPEGWAGFDIGPKTAEVYRERILDAKSIVWTGPMGAFETPPFDNGTRAIAEAVVNSDAFSVVGGGETGEAVASLGHADGVSYISTGGGACLALLRGKRLPALEALREA